MTDRTDSAAQRLRGGVWPVLDEQSERERRARIGGRVLELQRELSRREQRRQRWGVSVAVAALVAGVCSFVFYLRLEQPAAVPVASLSPSGEVRLIAGHASRRDGERLAPLGRGLIDLPGGSVVVTRAEESAELRLSSDTALSLAPASEVDIARRGPADGFEERVRLRAGSVALRVPKLGTRGKVSVETSDALIEVHGTQFTVRMVPRPPLEPFTEVQVREGRVLVRSGDESRFLGAGEHWTSRQGPEQVPSTVPAPEPAPPATPAVTPRAARAAGPRAVDAARATASELAAQNRLLEAAELAQKSGMPTLALQRLDTLIARYPEAELAHNARVERFRVLTAMGRHGEATAAARAYLARHPEGFAREEAERLVSARGAHPEP